ncbi:MAG: (2Fe-2S)-binding protein [Pseudomonadota bacterium]|nr:(2Fe-2S)-binding protein [Pseudomonadota bacterium]
MYVCLCKGVSNRTIRRCVDEGARSVEDVGRSCGAGTACGSCRLDIDGMLRDARSTSSAQLVPVRALAAK